MWQLMQTVSRIEFEQSVFISRARHPPRFLKGKAFHHLHGSHWCLTEYYHRRIHVAQASYVAQLRSRHERDVFLHALAKEWMYLANSCVYMLQNKFVRRIGLVEFTAIIYQRIRNMKPAQIVEGYSFTSTGFEDGTSVLVIIVCIMCDMCTIQDDIINSFVHACNTSTGARVVVHYAGQLHNATFTMHSALNPAYCYIQWEARRDGRFCAIPRMLIYDPMTIDLGPWTRRLPDRFAKSLHSIHATRHRAATPLVPQLDIGGLEYDDIIALLGVGTENRTFYNRTFVDALPEKLVHFKDVGVGCDSLECAICRTVSLKVGDRYKTFPCDCIMCIGCLTTWIVDHRGIKCPFCNQPVVREVSQA